MKKHYIISALFTLITTVATTQVNAGPYGDYFETYYGVETNTEETQAKTITKYEGVFSEYYNTFYTEKSAVQNKTDDTDLIEEMADPTNYFKW